jgi:hypothetical protein
LFTSRALLVVRPGSTPRSRPTPSRARKARPLVVADHLVDVVDAVRMRVVQRRAVVSRSRASRRPATRTRRGNVCRLVWESPTTQPASLIANAELVP